MPNQTDRMLFLAGLATMIAGLVLVFTIGATNKAETLIDWPHWLMIVGAMLQFPFATRLRSSSLAIVAAVMMTIGLVCAIGMSVIDLVFWSLADDTLRGTIASEVSATPSVWSPFMLYGSEEVLYVGFTLAGLSFAGSNKAGPALITLGAVLAIVGPSWFNVAGAVCVLAGFLLCFRAEHGARNA